MRSIVLTTTVLFLFFAVGVGQTTIESKTGLVSNTKVRAGCFEIANSKFKAGQSVSIVILNTPQSILKTTIANKLKKSCFETGDPGLSHYALRLSKKTILFNGIGLVVPAVKIADGIASADVNGDGKLDYFRICTSTEGAWLTIWAGKPLEGKRLWHTYSYAGYDTEPNCDKKDYDIEEH